MSIKVSIQGEQGSFHDAAARQFTGDELKIVPCETFAATFKALADGRAERAVVAIENSLYGSINEVYDLLLKHRLWIMGEVYLRIEQCLVGVPGADIGLIKEVHSHPLALAQCEYFLDETLPDALRFEHHDTAGSAADVKKWNDKSKSAIASREAATLYDLDILAKGIETNKANYTRFVVLQKNHEVLQNANKTSLILTAADKPGALYNALGVFAEAGINLSKLQSRPLIGQAWRYMFYVDVMANAASGLFLSAIEKLERQACEVKLLGSYPSGKR